MAIVGIESLIFGVDDLALSSKFFDDFGLVRKSSSETYTHYRLDEGSSVILHHIDDPVLPKSVYQGTGVKEVIWGVDTQANLDELVERIAKTQPVVRDDDGTVHFHSGSGLPIALRVFSRKKVTYAPDPVNAPGHVNRLNTPRKWKTRARPKTITHTVFAVPDPRAEYEWYRDHLDFRMSEEQIGMGFYLRCDGANEHHNLFLINMKFPALPGYPLYHHTNFGVEDIDELMIGTNYMTRRGWRTGPLGSGRHRIASALFSYLQCPAGGEAEYGADSDYIDDNWIPREWNQVFGTYCWMHNIPSFLGNSQKWEFRLHPEFLPDDKTQADAGWE
ncbi:VOC family protein [Rhizobium sp.]|jgi:catechol 2,3-dioxygenase-like lactoylglutathione lyase family enzyme|uniref:VOC family protein n=1 Tax=Rhizobium sp. TaxID=391 RepID=UPI000E8CAB88|nr:glyoxalase [Rhizobium sp.]